MSTNCTKFVFRRTKEQGIFKFQLIKGAYYCFFAVRTLPSKCLLSTIELTDAANITTSASGPIIIRLTDRKGARGLHRLLS